jgi:hypothetical protein
VIVNALSHQPDDAVPVRQHRCHGPGMPTDSMIDEEFF